MFRRGVIFTIFVAVVYMVDSALLYGSEDSLKEVMEGYESPQKLFMPQDAKHSDKDSHSNTLSASHNPQSQGISPRDMKLPKLPDWIYSTAIIESSFNDGSFKRVWGHC